jgi:hypothetical protein
MSHLSGGFVRTGHGERRPIGLGFASDVNEHAHGLLGCIGSQNYMGEIQAPRHVKAIARSSERQPGGIVRSPRNTGARNPSPGFVFVAEIESKRRKTGLFDGAQKPGSRQ